MANEELIRIDESNKVPTDRDLCAALLVAIATHPLVEDAVVYNPATPVDIRKPVKITKFRLYGGKELPTDELTLSLYPAASNLGGGSSGTKHFAEFTPQNLGPGNAEGSSDSVLAKFHLQLNLRDPDFDVSHTINYSSIDGGYNSWTPSDQKLYTLTESTYSTQYESWLTPKTLNIQILPAEEVLKEWISILRYVIRDIRRLRPFFVRNPQISQVFYESAEIFDENREALVFHRATIQFEIRYSEGNFGR